MTSASSNVVASVPLVEDTELLSAVAASVGVSCDARVLLIKGPTLARQGLRERRVSSDVDVLVEPRMGRAYLEHLVACGFDVSSFSSIWTELSAHAWHARLGGLSVPLDVHFEVPGLLRDPVDVFEELWGSRATERFAGVQVLVPSRTDHALLTAVTELRTVQSRAAVRLKIESLASAVASGEVEFQGDEVTERAVALGCSYSAFPLVAHFGDGPPQRGLGVTRRRVVGWRLRLLFGGTFAGVALERIVGGRTEHPIRTLVRALWPSLDDVRSLEVANARTRISATRYRMARLRRLASGAAVRQSTSEGSE